MKTKAPKSNCTIHDFYTEIFSYNPSQSNLLSKKENFKCTKAFQILGVLILPCINKGYKKLTKQISLRESNHFGYV